MNTPSINPLRAGQPRRPEPDVPGITVVPTRQRLRQVIVLGTGGHGRELADIVAAVADQSSEVSLLGLIDDNTPDRVLLARSGMRFLGGRSALDGRDVDLYLGVGYPHIRRAIDEALQRPADVMAHPSALVGSGVSLASGVVLAQNAIVTTNVKVGRHTHVNIGAAISHDCVLGDYVTVCPHATITGAATIGNDVFIGAGATILPGVTIGDGAVIGAGAVVSFDVVADTTVAGVPARQINSSDRSR